MTRIIVKSHQSDKVMFEMHCADARGQPNGLYAVVHEDLFWQDGVTAQQKLALINRIREQSDGVLFTLVPEGI